MDNSLLQSQPTPVSVLTDSDYAYAAQLIGCDIAAIKAVAHVETGSQGPFDSQGRPTILFERHVFHGLTGGKFDLQAPDISNSTPGGYGHFSEQYDRITRAAALDFEAALKSASWGMFQIMGENCAACGLPTVDMFVTTMRANVANHLFAFANFVKSSNALHSAIINEDWTTFARHYNGPSFAQNHYDVKLRDAFTSIKAATL